MPPIKLFLAGDVMTGRGIDQVLPRPSEPTLYEHYIQDARVYVELAERVNGPIPRPVSAEYVWGEALGLLQRARPDARIVNLETSITARETYWPGKGINYRMHPDNVTCLEAAGLDCCVLANNHVLDWGYPGLEETLDTLHGAGLRTAGAGRSRAEAQSPVVLDLRPRGRVLVFGFGSPDSGIPAEWAAEEGSPGVSLLTDLSPGTARRTAALIEQHRQPGDLVLVSIHWGGNWGYSIDASHRRFAHELIDLGAADGIHGHSSHHPKGIEVYRGVPVIYGCGDFLNDYEGIGGYERYRPELSLAYLISIDPTAGGLVAFELAPFRIGRFRLSAGSSEEVQWLREMLCREGGTLGTRVEQAGEGRLVLTWRHRQR